MQDGDFYVLNITDLFSTFVPYLNFPFINMKKSKSLKRKAFDSLNQLLDKTSGLQLQPANGRNFPILDTDQLIVSYPKSGNTWVCFLVSNLLFPDKTINFSNVLEIIPDIYDPLLPSNESRETRILKSHEYFDPRYKKVVYIVRDPRSVAVSYYHFLKRRKVIEKDYEFSKFLIYFLDGQYNAYGSWQENVGSWLGAVGNNDERFLLITYEHLLDNTYEVLKNISEFLNVTYSSEMLEKAIQSSSFEQMQSIEKNEQHNHQNFKGKDQSIPFVRRGEKDEWKNFFSKENEHYLYERCKSQMEILGYKKEY